jgi:superfamily I DNA/RNA helicase
MIKKNITPCRDAHDARTPADERRFKRARPLHQLVRGVTLAGVGHTPKASTPEEETRLFYVAATRATDKLLVTVSGREALGARLMERQGT